MELLLFSIVKEMRDISQVNSNQERKLERALNGSRRATRLRGFTTVNTTRIRDMGRDH